MLIVALLLLPAMGLLLLGMDRIEDRMGGAAARPESGNHRLRHLRLVHRDEHGGQDSQATDTDTDRAADRKAA